MNEEDIAKIVQAVLAEYQKRNSGHESSCSHESKHVCKCKKQRMTLAAANALIAKVQQKAAEMGLAVVVAVADSSGRPVAVQSMDGAYIASFDIA